MLMPPISRYMTSQPWTIRRDARLSQAIALMREHEVRHLPVLDAGALVGIVSERDVFRLERLASPGEILTVEDAMTVDVYTARSDEQVDHVVEAMAAHKYGAAIVVNRRDAVEGIFTSVDGLRVLADVLRRATA